MYGRLAASRPSLAYPILLGLAALDAAGYSLIAPVTPAIAEATGTGPAVIGALAASFPLGIVVGFAIAASAVRTIGSRAAFIVSGALVGVGCLGFVLGDGLPAYFASRFLMGIGSGGLWIGITLETLERWPGQEYLCMSRILAAYSVGGLVGPALGSIGGIGGPFAAYLALVGATVPLVLLMEGPPERLAFRPDRAALKLPGFWLASAGILLAVLALGVVEGILPLHFGDRLDQAQIGALYVAMSAIVALSAAASARVRPRRALIAAAPLVLVGIALAGAAGAVPLWIVALALAGVGIGAGNTGSIGILLEAAAPARIVTALVVWSQVGILGYLVGPLVGGSVVQALGFASIGLVPLGAAVILLGAFAWARIGGPAIPKESSS